MIGNIIMEKDFRDAYAALKLLRADLVKTRRDKQALEASLMHLQTHGLPPSAAHIRESRETQLMQQEDANSQLWRMAIQYENQLLEMKKMQMDNKCQKKEKTLEIAGKQQNDDDSSGEADTIEQASELDNNCRRADRDYFDPTSSLFAAEREAQDDAKGDAANVAEGAA
ncbi:unnamed protein product [Peronospora destructor]|uniref:Uncharacterized protein n=1 Tax=Peronospora destructor TaxID=86335 RepID=A0AAV0TB52_9STRA|nr:unnamed protein product [Peronospora destructor]